MFMVPIALEERKREHRTPSDTNEQPAKKAPGLDTDTRRLKDQDVEEHEDQRVVAGRPSAAALEHAFADDQLGGGIQHTVQSRNSGGEYQCPAAFFLLTSGETFWGRSDWGCLSS